MFGEFLAVWTIGLEQNGLEQNGRISVLPAPWRQFQLVLTVRREIFGEFFFSYDKIFFSVVLKIFFYLYKNIFLPLAKYFLSYKTKYFFSPFE